MAPRDGFEPPTNGLTVRRSTTELPGNAEEARIVGKPGLQVKEGGCGDADVSAETPDAAPSAQARLATATSTTRRIRAAASSKVFMSVAKDRRICPGAPKPDPGTTATPACTSRNSANSLSSLMPRVRMAP